MRDHLEPITMTSATPNDVASTKGSSSWPLTKIVLSTALYYVAALFAWHIRLLIQYRMLLRDYAPENAGGWLGMASDYLLLAPIMWTGIHLFLMFIVSRDDRPLRWLPVNVAGLLSGALSVVVISALDLTLVGPKPTPMNNSAGVVGFVASILTTVLVTYGLIARSQKREQRRT
jgi:hypothetical protein